MAAGRTGRGPGVDGSPGLSDPGGPRERVLGLAILPSPVLPRAEPRVKEAAGADAPLPPEPAPAGPSLGLARLNPGCWSAPRRPPHALCWRPQPSDGPPGLCNTPLTGPVRGSGQVLSQTFLVNGFQSIPERY